MFFSSFFWVFLYLPEFTTCYLRHTGRVLKIPSDIMDAKCLILKDLPLNNCKVMESLERNTQKELK